MNDQGLIYLDNAATTFPKPEVVYQEMDGFYRKFGGNAGRGANPLARRAMGLVSETRALLQDWLDAPEVVFTPSATIALNTVIFGARLRRGDVVYVSPFEHNSVLRPLEQLRKTTGIEVRVLPFDKQTFMCQLDKVKSLFRVEPPAMVCITQVSNVFGIVLPVSEIATLARQSNSSAIVAVDGAQAAGLKPLPLPMIDALVFSGHKSLYGPYGVAGIAFGCNWRPATFIFGGTGTQSESLEMPEDYARYEAGSLNISAIAGLNAALKWLCTVGREEINLKVEALTNVLVQRLDGIERILVRAQNASLNSGIVSFTVDAVSPQQVETLLGAKGVSVRAGLHCAPWSHMFSGTIERGGTVRVSVGYFNSEADVEFLQKALCNLSTLNT
jgi:selenocysteine lyase/cysteine desulfurase